MLLHHGLGSVETWRGFPDTLSAKTGLDVFVYSGPGHGASEIWTEDGPLDYFQYESDVVLPAVLKSAGIGDFFLYGHSDGATIALLFAASRQSTGLLGVVSEAGHVFVESITLAGIRKTVKDYEKGLLARKLEKFHGPNTDKIFWKWAGTWLNPAFEEWSIQSRLSEIHVPILVIQGENDPYATEAQVQVIRDSSGSAVKPLLLPGCGHEPFREKETEVLDAVNRFVSENFPSGIA